MKRLGLLTTLCLVSAAAHEISGLVVDSQGKPVAGAAVWLNQERTPRKTETDAAGLFRFDKVATGPIEIVSWKEGYAVGGVDAQVAGTAMVSLMLAEPGKLDIRLISRGRNPETGAELPPVPVEGARIRSMRIDDTFTVSVEDLAPLDFPSPRSDAEGRLVVPFLPKSGHLGFEVSHREFTDALVPYYPVGQREIVLQMRPGVVLRGRVTNEAGEGVARARVSVFRADQSALREFNEAMTDPEGFYSVQLPPGDYYVTAKHMAYATPEPKPGHLGPEANDAYCDLTLPNAYAITGKIIGTDGQPVGGVKVQYVVKNVVYEQTISDALGSFCLNVAPGEGRIHVDAPDGYMTDQATDIDVKMGRENVAMDKPIRLQVLPEIVGTAVDPEGAPVKNALVSSLGLAPAQIARTDETGHFAIQLPRVPTEGKALFRIEHPRRFLQALLEVSLGDLKPLEVKLTDFEPNLKPCDPAHTRNKQLDGLRGKAAPNIACDLWFNLPEGEASSKDALTLENLRGKVVVLDFWGGFDDSEAGRARGQELNALYAIFQDSDDVAFVGIHDAGNEQNEIRDYIRQRGILYPVGRDADASTFDLYDISSIPQTVLIDKKGVLRFYDIEGRLLELIKSLRRESP